MVRAAGPGAGLPVTAAPGIARSVIRFTVNVIPDPEHPDTADTLEAMCDGHLVLARGALRIAVRTESIRCAPPFTRWACCAGHDG
ncbi:hypothetical protein ACLQ2H_17510 [Streptomyces globisporus]|uniref:hypothetical protein n=1 Tax=Streptomyces globisporus TaxID=1908 RepID=UPI003CF9C411